MFWNDRGFQALRAVLVTKVKPVPSQWAIPLKSGWNICHFNKHVVRTSITTLYTYRRLPIHVFCLMDRTGSSCFCGIFDITGKYILVKDAISNIFLTMVVCIFLKRIIVDFAKHVEWFPNTNIIAETFIVNKQSLQQNSTIQYVSNLHCWSLNTTCLHKTVSTTASKPLTAHESLFPA